MSRILVRAISYTVHGLIPASCVFADRYNREEVVRSLGKEVNINPPLMLGQLPDTPEELLKLDQVRFKKKTPSCCAIQYSFVLELYIYAPLKVDMCNRVYYTKLYYVTNFISLKVRQL